MRGITAEEYAQLEAAVWCDVLPCEEDCSEEDPYTPGQAAVVAALVERGLLVRRSCPWAVDGEHPRLTDLGCLAMDIHNLVSTLGR